MDMVRVGSHAGRAKRRSFGAEAPQVKRRRFASSIKLEIFLKRFIFLSFLKKKKQKPFPKSSPSSPCTRPASATGPPCAPSVAGRRRRRRRARWSERVKRCLFVDPDLLNPDLASKQPKTKEKGPQCSPTADFVTGEKASDDEKTDRLAVVLHFSFFSFLFALLLFFLLHVFLSAFLCRRCGQRRQRFAVLVQRWLAVADLGRRVRWRHMGSKMRRTRVSRFLTFVEIVLILGHLGLVLFLGLEFGL
ncbi:uncharacterized protein LOC105765691 [Gossypium raimondii]|uniref:uncharacterized protein LOC105765691 n=1 Tax=Gossypium raimondii TaxID=29730 RepID=UPI00227B0727|nr:uncharacterized protein LOC105765691 [Gossypium raimondii]